MAVPEDFAEPGLGVDPRINRDSSYGNRRHTPPAGEDVTIPSSSLLAESMVGHSLVTTEQVDVSYKNSIHPSTFDIPDSEFS